MDCLFKLQRHQPCSAMESSIPWGKIMEKLDGRDIITLALCNKTFLSIAMEEYTWKIRCLQELGCNAPSSKPQFGWLDIYKSITDGSHTYSSRQSDKHIVAGS
ncbi:hypothetical protein CLOP_g40006 [Closterium sp. NIES-67]|nr:hypothetical protein CLOP_g40006 [Closterium sp. NIES-67]